MKILTPQQIADADLYIIENQGVTAEQLMERAATKCFDWFVSNFRNTVPVSVFCGSGNNGGDGLVIARLLKKEGFSVRTYIVDFGNRSSVAFMANLEQLKEERGEITLIESAMDFPSIAPDVLIVDAIFGNGLNRTPQGFVLDLIAHINNVQARVVSVDMPSGLFAQKAVTCLESVVKADKVLSFQQPKLALLLPDNQYFVKDWILLDIGLDRRYIDSLTSPYYYLSKEMVAKLYHPRKNQWAHKGIFGHGLVIGGSYGKIGAVVLATKALLQIGTGLVTAYIPRCGYGILQTAVPEVMVETDEESLLQKFRPNIVADVIAVGPGMGTEAVTVQGFASFLMDNTKPLVLDADALNILAKHPEFLSFLPEGTILTPHPKELERLIGTWQNDYEKIAKVQKMAQTYKLIIVVKGRHSMVVSAEKTVFNSTGNNALATAGSGDVLTGIITGLLAQKYSAMDATLLGVYLHGRTAELYTQVHASETFVASFILKYLSLALKELEDAD